MADAQPMRIVIVGGGLIRLDDGRGARQGAQGALPDHADRVGGNRHGGASARRPSRPSSCSIAMLELDEKRVRAADPGHLSSSASSSSTGRASAIATSMVSARWGQDTWTVDFHQYWLKQYLAGKAKELEYYSIQHNGLPGRQVHAPARRHAEVRPLSQIAYAFHFDASLYARYLRGYSEARGVQRVEGRIVDVQLREGDGYVRAVRLNSGADRRGRAVNRLLRIPRSADRGAPCTPDSRTGRTGCPAIGRSRCRAVRLTNCTPIRGRRPRQAGWQWRIPLQAPHRQRLRLFEQVPERGRGDCGAARQTLTASRSRSRAPSASRRDGASSPGTATWCRWAWPVAFSSPWSRPASTWCRSRSPTCWRSSPQPASRRRDRDQ